MKAIVNTKLVLEDGLVWDGAITYDKGVIVQTGPRSEVEIPADAQIIDADGLYTAPGLIDIHNHGSEDDLFVHEPMKCVEHFIRHGETTILPTMYYSLTLQQMAEGAEKIRAASKSGLGRVMNGLYMEGPYMNSNGSNQREIRWQGDILREEYEPLLDALGDMVRIWAIDPAREGIEGFMQDVNDRYPKAIFALGHSYATAADCRRVAKYGVKVQTHHGDSGKAPGFAQGCIGPGCDEYTLYNPDMYAELISDEVGIHLHADMLRMVVRTKGVERIVLITDSMASKEKYRNNEAEGIAYGPDLNYDYEGHLAGSRMTLDNACRNFMAHTGYGICHAIRCATLNPARLLGIEDTVGTLTPGKKANLIVMNDMIRIQKVIFEGELAVENDRVIHP